MPQIHLRAEPGDYAPIVILPGDPNRATAIAALFDGGLEATRRVNDHRLLYGYTGTCRGVPISVQTTGIGAPSAAIVVEELLRLGARRLIRVGTCGGIGKGIRTGEIVIASAASPFDGTTATYLHGEPYAPAADFGLLRALVEAAQAEGAVHHVGPICTVDVFYNPDLDYVGRWAARGVIALEMEASAIFFLAARARATGADVRAAAILTVSDVLAEGVTSKDSYLPLDELERRTALTLRVALAAATSPAATAGV
jgi:DeoD family purine-nucleoside phosphorylase